MLFRGAVCVPIDPHGEIETITNFIENSEAKMAFIGADFIKDFHDFEERLGRKIPAVVLQDIESNNGFQSFSDWAKTPRPADFDSSPPPAKIARRFGGFDLHFRHDRHAERRSADARQYLLRNVGCQEVMNVSENEVVLSVLPLFHVFAQVVNLWVIASIGGSVYYVKELAPAELKRLLKQRKSRLLTGVPRLWYLFHKKIFDGVAAQPNPVRRFSRRCSKPIFLRDNFNVNLGKKFFGKVHDGFGGKLNITISAGSRFDEKIARDYHALGFTIIQGYGLTETTGAVAARDLKTASSARSEKRLITPKSNSASRTKKARAKF
jgi:long-chain acyl-CoA synthetase